MSDNDSFSPPVTPDWVMFGINQGPDGVALYASKSLTKAEMMQVLDLNGFSVYGDHPRYVDQLSEYRLILNAQMHEFVVVIASTYQKALENLFKSWSADADDNDPTARSLAQGGEVK